MDISAKKFINKIYNYPCTIYRPVHGKVNIVKSMLVLNHKTYVSVCSNEKKNQNLINLSERSTKFKSEFKYKKEITS